MKRSEMPSTNEFIGWDDRKTAFEVYQDAINAADWLDRDSEHYEWDARYLGLLAVARWGAEQGFEEIELQTSFDDFMTGASRQNRSESH